MAETDSLLDESDHSRDSAGMEYVYPVVSRRAAGLSVGINLNPNNACNWRCIYCQVPELKRGGPPPLDLPKLEGELSEMLAQIIQGAFMERRLAVGMRRLMDVAFSGNGEPTSNPGFQGAIDCVGRVLGRYELLGKLPIRLITNGSLVERTYVSEGLRALALMNGEVWFKVDGLAASVIQRINNSRTSPDLVLRRLERCANLCPTWVQSCFFSLDGQQPQGEDLDVYIEGIGSIARKIRGVHLYGLARPSLQPEASRLGRLPAEWFDALALRLNEKGLTVTVSP